MLTLHWLKASTQFKLARSGFWQSLRNFRQTGEFWDSSVTKNPGFKFFSLSLSSDRSLICASTSKRHPPELQDHLTRCLRIIRWSLISYGSSKTSLDPFHSGYNTMWRQFRVLSFSFFWTMSLAPAPVQECGTVETLLFHPPYFRFFFFSNHQARTSWARIFMGLLRVSTCVTVSGRITPSMKALKIKIKNRGKAAEFFFSS